MSLSTIILLFVLLVGVLAAMRYLGKYREDRVGTPEAVDLCEVTGSACFGGEYCHVRRHLKAERNLPVYFEDEELDRFRGRKPDDFSDEEAREWEEVLTTLHPKETIDWVGSIHRRGLHIPAQIRPRLKSILSMD